VKRAWLILILIVVFLSSVILVYRLGFQHRNEEVDPIVYTDTTEFEPVIIREYGIPVDSFIITSGKVERNQTLSGILANYHVPARKIDRVAARSRGIFDLRKIRAGKPYKVYCAKDSLQTVRYFVYEHTPVNYLFIELNDTIIIRNENKEISIRIQTGSGQITSSLWNAMIDRDLQPMLAFELSEIFAWSIDFFGLHAGDAFKIIYDEHYTDSAYVGLGRIHAAWFSHAGADFYAIPFMQDSVESYFDEEGNSLRKAFLKAPLRFSRISSRYSHSRMHPILKIRRPHLGVDYAAPAGTPVYAIGDGEIIKAAYNKSSGHMVRIKHNSVYSTAYLHLSRYGKGIAPGTYVKQGDLIGYVGSTGLSTGPHLDFRFYKNGYAVDPLKVEAPPVEPVKENNLAVYDSVKADVIKRLEMISLPVQDTASHE